MTERFDFHPRDEKKKPTEFEASVKPTTMIHVTFLLSSVQKKNRQNAKSVQKIKLKS